MSGSFYVHPRCHDIWILVESGWTWEMPTAITRFSCQMAAWSIWQQFGSYKSETCGDGHLCNTVYIVQVLISWIHPNQSINLELRSITNYILASVHPMSQIFEEFTPRRVGVQLGSGLCAPAPSFISNVSYLYTTIFTTISAIKQAQVHPSHAIICTEKMMNMNILVFIIDIGHIFNAGQNFHWRRTIWQSTDTNEVKIMQVTYRILPNSHPNALSNLNQGALICTPTQRWIVWLD